MFKKFVLLTAVLVAFAGTSLLAGNGTDKKMDDMSKMSKSDMMGQMVTLKGKLVCLACSLKPEGAHAACKEFGHRYALMTKDGKYISLLPNKYSQELLNGHDGGDKMVELTGTYFANADVLDVSSYKVEDGKMITWCDVHHKMDACGAH